MYYVLAGEKYKLTFTKQFVVNYLYTEQIYIHYIQELLSKNLQFITHNEN